jgi:hypothetical protein
MSDCCDAPAIEGWETPMCSSCKEHCDVSYCTDEEDGKLLEKLIDTIVYIKEELWKAGV